MQELENLLRKAVKHSQFNSHPLGLISLEDLHDLYKKGRKSGGQSRHIFPEVECREEILDELVEHLNLLLKDFVSEETDLIGYGVDHVMGVVIRRRAKDIALMLIRAAALLTPIRAADMFTAWVEGSSFQYKIVGLLNGVSIEKSLSLDEGIQIEELPESMSEIPASSPLSGMLEQQYKGGVALFFDVEAKPAFYKFQNELEYGINPIKHTWAGGELLMSLLHDFCEAMSLSCNHCIRPVNVWVDCGDLLAFGSGSFSLSWRVFQVTGKSPSIPLSQELLVRAWEIYSKRRDINKSQPALHMSIRRWMKSKQNESSLTDKFIELRIALEALYLNDVEDELKFRLATRGAGHLGKSPEEREKHYKTLSDAYKFASKAVHGKEVDKKKKNLLKNAQDLCRMGILKKLSGVRNPDWEKMILGATS